MVLTTCLVNPGQIAAIINHEYRVLVECMDKHANQMLWRREIDLIMAAKFKLKLEDVGLTRTMAENLTYIYLAKIAE